MLPRAQHLEEALHVRGGVGRRFAEPPVRAPGAVADRAAVGHVEHEVEVEVEALAARQVLLVAQQPVGAAGDAEGVALGGPAFQARLLLELAERGLEGRLAGLHLAAHRQPELEPRVEHEEHLALVAREDGDAEGAAHGQRMEAGGLNPGEW